MTESRKYDPKTHDGCLHADGSLLIIQNAEQAKLHTLPLAVRLELKRQTALEIALHDFASGAGKMIIENVDEEYAQALVQGYLKGIELLQISRDVETNKSE